MQFDELFLRKALSEVTILRSTFPEEAFFAVDTRLLQKGDIFIALQGAHHDGHTYIEQALKKGAAGLIIASDKKHYFEKIPA